MWGGGQDSVEPQHGLWGTPGHSQNAWQNGVSNNAMNYPPRPPQWQNQMNMQQGPGGPPWGYQQPPQQPPHWHMPLGTQQQLWPNQGFGYDDKRNDGRGNRGYGNYPYPGMQSMAPQPPAWNGQRDMYQGRGAQQWDNSQRGHNGGNTAPWNNSNVGSNHWQNDWQNMRENDGGSGSPGIGQALNFDTWPSVGQPTEEAVMWRDPKPKKKIRDTGVQAWGDPQAQMVNFDKILRWKDADHEEFQKGPSTSTWNQGANPWADQNDSCWPANVWESSEAVLADDPESRALNFAEDSIRGFSGSKLDFTNPTTDMNDPTVFALQNAFQRALTTGLLPQEVKKHPMEPKFKMMVNTLLQKMVKEEQAEAELEHIRQLMARGDYPVTVAQEHERINNEREGFKTEITILSDEIKNNLRDSSAWLNQWKNRNTSISEGDVLSAALESMGIQDAPKVPNPAPWAEGSTLHWNEPAPISINTDLDRPSKLEDGERKTTTGPQEFIPGKKWEWHDPAKVAEDPNATPGSVKPSFASPSWGNGSCDPWIEKSDKKSSTDEASDK